MQFLLLKVSKSMIRYLSSWKHLFMVCFSLVSSSLNLIRKRWRNSRFVKKLKASMRIRLRHSYRVNITPVKQLPVEVGHNDGDGQSDAEHTTDGTQ